MHIDVILVADDRGTIVGVGVGDGMRGGYGLTSGAVERRRILDRIQLLCRCGAGLEAIASPLCAAIRDLLGVDSAAVFWLDPQSASQGFYHDCAPAEVKDAFISRYAELFSGPGELTVVDLVGMTGQSIARCLEPETYEAMCRSNVYKFLFEPCGHHYALDMRIDIDGRGRAVVVAFNPIEHPFRKEQIELLASLQTVIQRAAAADKARARWRPRGARGIMIADLAGERLIAIDAQAEAMLKAGQLMWQNISLTGPMGRAPTFVRQLGQALADGVATTQLSVPDGRLTARAHAIRAVDQPAEVAAQMFVALDLEVATEVLAIEYLSSLPLSPLQREIALFAMLGGGRAESQAEFGVSDEALKKHARVILAATKVTKWTELAQITLLS